MNLKVEIENGNVLVIQNGLAVNSKYCEVRKIYEWCFKNQDVPLRHILRDNNKVADRIAKKVRGKMEQLIIHIDPPEYVKNLLEDDIYISWDAYIDGGKSILIQFNFR